MAKLLTDKQKIRLFCKEYFGVSKSNMSMACLISKEMNWEMPEHRPDIRRFMLKFYMAKGGDLSKPKTKPPRNKKYTSADFYPSNNFYTSKEWRSLRYKVLRKYGAACQLCGATPKSGIILYVDHVKPRSRYPNLELDIDNLQILCEDCNLGKSNKYDDDWRGEQTNGLNDEQQSHMDSI